MKAVNIAQMRDVDANHFAAVCTPRQHYTIKPGLVLLCFKGRFSHLWLVLGSVESCRL